MVRKTIPKKIKNFVLIASKHQCSICQAHAIDVHHIKPVSKGGTNDLENLMVVCPNHHREYHQGKFSKEQMEIYRNQWIQKCNIFLGVGIPLEVITKDQKLASSLPIEVKMEFLEKYSGCLIQNISEDSNNLTIYFWSSAQIWSEITHDVISLVQSSFRFFKNVKSITGVCIPNRVEEKYYGLDTPDLYSFTVKMSDIEEFIFGKSQLIDFWQSINFFKKERPDVMNNNKINLNMPMRI